MKSIAPSVALVVVLIGLGSGLVLAAPVAEPETPAAPAKSARSAQEIMADIQAAGKEIKITSSSDIVDETKRAAIAPKTAPALRKMLDLARELRQNDDPRIKQRGESMTSELLPLAALFGDKTARDEIEKMAKSKDAKEASQGKANQLLVDWIGRHKDATAQGKLLDGADALVKADPASDALTSTLMEMTQLGAASPELAQRAEELAGQMKSPMAAQLQEQLAAAKKLRAMEAKPLVLAGARNDGGKFTTADWKGKVILVDFWATWCGPCRAELPRVKKAYKDFHEKGLEILGVSCDNEGAELTQFLAENKDMPWPQLFDAAHPGWHPLATEYGITGIPTMFLIDKKGIVRTVKARENFEELIPKMLAE